MARMTGGGAIVQSLIEQGVDLLFGLPGAQLDPLFNALHDARDKIRVIHTRHEQGAAYMAMGYAASTGRPGVYAVVPGPGFLNSTAALCTAYAINAPVLCVTGEIPTAHIGQGLGLLHELPDQLGIMRRLTKWAERIESPADAPPLVAEAFRQMTSGRPRPVGLEMARDRMTAEGEAAPAGKAGPHPNPPLDEDAIADAARILGEAKSPMIYVGGGASGAREEITALAELLQAPVVAFRQGRGILTDRHYLSQGMVAGNRLWVEADAVLAVGTRLQIPLMQWGRDENLKIIRVDIDPEEPARATPPDVSIVADSREALARLLPLAEKHNRKRASREEELTALKLAVAEDLSFLEPQRSYLAAIRAALPENGIFIDEVTQVGYMSWYEYPVYEPRTYINSGYQGTLGYGYATALGVKAAHPDRPVVSISGDGGFFYNVMELSTAVQQNLALVTVVFTDGAFGNVKRMQKELYGGREIASTLHNPDLVRLAESYGVEAFRAESPEEVRAAIERGLDSPGPTLIEAPVGEMPSPWPFLQHPRVRGG